MFETIAMFGGIIGGIVAILSIIVFILLKKNVIDILNKDAILFDTNFEIKLKTLTESMSMIDELSISGKTLTLDAKFTERAKTCYNNLLCVVTNVHLADEFYALTLDRDVPFDEKRLAEYKIYCRKDIGFKIGKTTLLTRASKQDEMGVNEAMLRMQAATGNPNAYYNQNNFSANSPTNMQQNLPANQQANPQTRPQQRSAPKPPQQPMQ